MCLPLYWASNVACVMTILMLADCIPHFHSIADAAAAAIAHSLDQRCIPAHITLVSIVGTVYRSNINSTQVTNSSLQFWRRLCSQNAVDISAVILSA